MPGHCGYRKIWEDESRSFHRVHQPKTTHGIIPESESISRNVKLFYRSMKCFGKWAVPGTTLRYVGLPNRQASHAVQMTKRQLKQRRSLALLSSVDLGASLLHLIENENGERGGSRWGDTKCRCSIT